MLSDNADRQEKLIVYRSADGSMVGEGPLFTPGASGTENSMIGVQNSIVGACTFGYPYAQYPDTKPAYRAQVAPGMERWDVNDDASGITLKWRNNGIYSAAVPRLSTADNLIYTCERPRGPAGVLTGPVVYACAIDMDSGRVVHRQRLPRLANLLAGGDPSQMVGVIDKHGVWWQGTIGGIYRISRHGDGVSGVQGASSLPLGAAFGAVSDALGAVGDGVGAVGSGVAGAVGAVGDAVGSTVGAAGVAGGADATGAVSGVSSVGGGTGKVAGKVAGAAKLDGDQFLSATRVLVGLVQGRGHGELGHGQLSHGGLGSGELGAGGLKTAAKIADGVVNPTATAQIAANQIAANQGALPGNSEALSAGGSEALSAGGANAASVEALLAEGIVSQCAKCPPSAALMGTFGEASVSLRLISADESVVVPKERGRSAKFTNMPKALSIINDGNSAWKAGTEFTVRSRRLNNLGQSLSNKNISKEYYFKAEVAPARGASGGPPVQSATQPQSITLAAVAPGRGADGQKDADRSDGAVKAADLEDAGVKFVRQEGHDSILALTADLPAGKAITVNLSWKVLRGAVERPNEKYQILALKTVDADKSSFFQAQSPEVLATKG